jgi:hypothetical protein
VRRIPLSWALSRAIAASLVAAVLLVAALSLQMSLGRDPGLGPKLTALSPGSDGPSAAQTAAAGLPAQIPPPAPVQTTTS